MKRNITHKNLLPTLVLMGWKSYSNSTVAKNMHGYRILLWIREKSVQVDKYKIRKDTPPFTLGSSTISHDTALDYAQNDFYFNDSKKDGTS